MSRSIILAVATAGWMLGLLSSLIAVDFEVISRESFTLPSRPISDMMLFDFTKIDSVSNWTEMSDTVREAGLSKAVIVLQQTQVFQVAVFFSLLNAQPNGAGFAGVRSDVTLDLSNYRAIKLRARAQGDTLNYKMVLRHKGEDKEPYPTYESFFTMPKRQLREISLPFDEFLTYYRGRRINTSEPLDTSRITNIGLQVYGGVYSPIKQSGPGSMELEWIKAV